MRSILFTICFFAFSSTVYAGGTTDPYENGVYGYPPDAPIQKMEGFGNEITIEGGDRAGVPVPPIELPENPVGTVQSVLNPNNNGIIDPPRVNQMVAAPKGEKTIGHPVPPAKREAVGVKDDHKIIDPAPLARLENQNPNPVSGGAADQNRPPVGPGVISLPRLAENLANLSSDIVFNEKSAKWVGAGILTIALIEAGILAYTRNPQVAHSFGAMALGSSLSVSNGDGVYNIPGHEVYSKEDAEEVANIWYEMTDEEALEHASSIDPALYEYTVLVLEAIRMGRIEDYNRACPNPALCS